MFDMIAELVRVVIANALESTFVLSNLEFYSWQLVSIFCISNLIVSIVFGIFLNLVTFYNHFICPYVSIHLHRKEILSSVPTLCLFSTNALSAIFKISVKAVHTVYTRVQIHCKKRVFIEHL